MLNNKNFYGQYLIKCLSINSSVYCLHSFRYLSKQNTDLEDIKKCCDILKINDIDFTAIELKNAYLERCKRTHPDIKDDGNHEFLLVENAFRVLKQYLKNKLNESEIHKKINNFDEEEEEDINRMRHKVPQHRQYLSYDGLGFGTPSERLKQYERQRLNRASESVNEFQLNKIKSMSELSVNDSIALREIYLQKQNKIRQGFDRLVEDLIQESIAKGDFDNLPGSGKPLKYRPEIPYLDSTTYKLNEILINNGFVPEWVLLMREIRDERNSIRKELLLLKNEQKLEDIKKIKKIETQVKELNLKINKYNTIVPIINKQQIHFILRKEIEKIKEMPFNNSSNDSTEESLKSLKSDFNQNNNNKVNTNCNRIKVINNEDSYQSRDNLLKKILSLFS